MRKILLILSSLAIITFSTASQAGLLVEPVLGLNFSTETDTREKDYSSGDGVGYGGRLGYQSGPLQVGLDYLNSTIKMSSGDFNRDITEQEYGAFVGFEFPILVRIYGTYIFSTVGDTKINEKSENLNGGTGYKLGVGFTLLPLLDINLDYRQISFNDSFDVDTMMLSLSMPFDLF